MPHKLITVRVLVASAIVSMIFLVKPPFQTGNVKTGFPRFTGSTPDLSATGLPMVEEDESDYSEARERYELKRLRNPVTGTIPRNIHEIELAAAARIPDRGAMVNSPRYRGLNQNTYVNSGPNNIAGRSRAFDFDRRNTNIIISGGTQGGIFRSTNGGTNWTFVSPAEDIRSCTAIAQDPTQPDTWYAGTGEAWYPASSADVANGTFGFGIYKSTDNGASWTKLAATIQNNDENTFDNSFDVVYRIAVHPTTGHVYAAVHRAIMRSKDKGATWDQVLGSTTRSLFAGMTDLIIASDGSRIFTSVTGENPTRSIGGVWTSTTGDANSWTRIAGGTQVGVDSVAGWQPYGKWGRVVMALNSNNTQLFTLVKNANEASGATPKPEADLFRASIAGNPPYTWTNLNSYVPDEPGINIEGIDPYTTQFNGYNMSIAVKPDNANILFIGGTSLFRVDLSQTDATKKFRRIGGYGQGLFTPNRFIYPNHHPDIHYIRFLPNSNTTMFTASDGGIHRTANPMADSVAWVPLVGDLQTTHFQHVSLCPEEGCDFIMGGTQDNGSLVNFDPFGSKDQDQILSGDGGTSAITSFTRTGNNWKQNFYISYVQGTVIRFSWNLLYDPVNNSLGNDPNSTPSFTDITPSNLGGQGQWLTQLFNDPDSSDILFYNSKNKLYRTTKASTVTPTGWTEMTGFGNTIPAADELTVMNISKSINRSAKYLFVGTDNGHLYRLSNPSFAAASTVPVNISPAGMGANHYVSGIAINPRNPDTVMAVVSNYDAGANTVQNIYWTGNATAASPTWQVIDGALAPLSVQSCEIVVKTTGVEYYVGTSVGLYSTLAINGGSTAWVQEGTGMLRRAIVRSLRNRPQDNVMVVGTHGNGTFVTEIGNAVKYDVATGIDPVVNDRSFIVQAYPTLTRNTVSYTTGSLFSVRKLQVQVASANGQVVLKRVTGYMNGSLDFSSFTPGTYILTIDSDDGKYRFVQKIVKQ